MSTSISVRQAGFRLAKTSHQVMTMLATGRLKAVLYPGQAIKVDETSLDALAAELQADARPTLREGVACPV